MLSREMIGVYHNSYDDFDTPEGADMRRLLAHVDEQQAIIDKLVKALERVYNCSNEPNVSEYVSVVLSEVMGMK